ncbi:alpha/beta hydrolase [Streptomyces sp. NPDC005805]|uniref:alpha/beta fold hydrolase n=1 Tax=Streptomyces sp. NPDC005805 TaxID=3157068 RepID=UPI0033E4A11E
MPRTTPPTVTTVQHPFPGQTTRPDDTRRSGVTEHRLRVQGYRYAARVVRSAAPVAEPALVLGGSSQDRYSWTRHERRLAEVCDVVTADLPGYGSADFLPADRGTDFLAEAVAHLLDELGLPRVNLVGACFGGAVGLRVAQRHPQRIARLMLVGMTRAIPADYAAAMVRWDGLIRAGDTATVARELADRFMSPAGAGTVRRHAAVSRLVHQQIAGQSPEEMAKSAEHNTRLMRHDWYRADPLPAVPTLVVTGEHDTLTTPAMGRDLAAHLPGARFLTVRETDHLAPIERISDFAELMARFCAGERYDDLPYLAP